MVRLVTKSKGYLSSFLKFPLDMHTCLYLRPLFHVTVFFLAGGQEEGDSVQTRVIHAAGIIHAWPI